MRPPEPDLRPLVDVHMMSEKSPVLGKFSVSPNFLPFSVDLTPPHCPHGLDPSPSVWTSYKIMDGPLPWTTIWKTPSIRRSTREAAGVLMRLAFEWRSRNSEIMII